LRNDFNNNATLAKLSTFKSDPSKAEYTDYGRIDSVQKIVMCNEVTGFRETSGVLVCGTVGSRIGTGPHDILVTVVGAVRNAVTTNEIEKRANSIQNQQIIVHLEDDSVRKNTQANPSIRRLSDNDGIINGTTQPKR